MAPRSYDKDLTTNCIWEDKGFCHYDGCFGKCDGKEKAFKKCNIGYKWLEGEKK